MKRFYRLVIFTISWGAVTSSYSQEQASASFTLEQCIEYALKNSINAQNAEIDQQIAIARVRETVGLGLPQVSGSVAIQHNEQLRRFFGRYSTSTTGFSFFNATAAAALSGNIVITNLTGNTWAASGTCGATSTIFSCITGGSIALAAALTAVRITTINGTDTFDSGLINILYE
jgi:hypothetical protein